jgi:hopanoid biosynthesis associated protein HpnK
MRERLLIVTGDDFGAAPETNAGIIEAHRQGILTSASLMVTGAAAGDAVRLARESPDLAVGLHLVLVQGRPASPPSEIPRLVGADGLFREAPIPTGLRYAATSLGRDGRVQLTREIDAQLAAFARTGLALSHVDGHCNMHLHPMVLPVLLELAARRGVRAVRLTRDPLLPALRLDRAHALGKLGEGTVWGGGKDERCDEGEDSGVGAELHDWVLQLPSGWRQAVPYVSCCSPPIVMSWV